MRQHETDTRLFVCYFDAEIAKAPPPVPGSSASPGFNRARVLVSEAGDSALDAAGYHDTPGYGELAVLPPPSA